MSTQVVYRQRYQEGDEPVPGYRLTQQLGEGAMGVVWKASAPGQMVCALKIINLDQTGGKKEFRSLQRVKAINHPNLVPIHCIWLKDEHGNILADEASQAGMLDSHAPVSDAPPRSRETMTLAKADTDPSDSRLKGTMVWSDQANPADSATYHPTQLLIAMGLGQSTLFKRLQDCQERGDKGIPERELLRYMTQSADAIDFLNQQCQIIHCDIKPQNILIVGNAAQVCDFGLARRMADARQTTAAFTAYYAPLELITDNEPTQTTDQYSLAIAYIELKVGRPPYESETHGRIIKDKLSGHMDLRGLGPNETEVILKATAILPADRYPSCAEMVRALSEALDADKKQAGPWGAILRFAAVILLLAALGGGGFAGWKYRAEIAAWWDKLIHPDPLPLPPPLPDPDKAIVEFNKLLDAEEYVAAAVMLRNISSSARDEAAQRLFTPWWTSLRQKDKPDQGHHSVEELQEFLRTYSKPNAPPSPEVIQALSKRDAWLAVLTQGTIPVDLSATPTANELKQRLHRLDEWKQRLDWIAQLRKEHSAERDPWDLVTLQPLERTTQLALVRTLVRTKEGTPIPKDEVVGLLEIYKRVPEGWTSEEQQRWRFCQLVLDSQQPAESALAKVLPELEKVVGDQKGLDGWESGRVEKIKDAWLEVLPDTLEEPLRSTADQIWMGPVRYERGLKRLRAAIAKKEYSEARRLLASLATDFPAQAAALLPFDVELQLRANQPLPPAFWPQLGKALAQTDNRETLLTLLQEQAPARPESELLTPAIAELTKVYAAADESNQGQLKLGFTALLKLHLDRQWAQLTVAPQDLVKSLELYRALAGDGGGKPSPQLTAWLVELQLAAEPKADSTRQAQWKRLLAAASSAIDSGDPQSPADAAYVAFVSACVDGRDPTTLRQVAGGLAKLLEPAPAWLTMERRRAACELLTEGALSVRLPKDDDLKLSGVDKYQDKECRPWLELADKLGGSSWRRELAWTLVLSCQAQPADDERRFAAADEVLTKHQTELKPLPMYRQIHLARGRAALARYDATKNPSDLELAVADHAAAIEGLFQFRSPIAKVSDVALFQKIISPLVPVLMTHEVSPASLPKAAHLMAVFGRLVDRSTEVRKLVGAAEPKPPTGEPEPDEQVLALRAAYRALERSTRWFQDIDAQVIRGKVLLELPDNDLLAEGLQGKLDEIDKHIGNASGHPGAAVLQASILLRRGRRVSDLTKTRDVFRQALQKCDEARNYAGDVQDELLTQILEVRSDLHLNLAFLAPTPSTRQAMPDQVENHKYSRGWHLKRAAEDAQAATQITARQNPENAFNALGNALEDQAYYMRWDLNTTYDQALKAFRDGNTAALDAGDSREALCLFNLGRCQVRFAEDKYSELSDRQGMFATAAENLRKAVSRWGSFDDRKSEAYYWLSRSLARQAGAGGAFTMPEGGGGLSIDAAAAECAKRACDLAKASGRYEWAEFVLHRSELALIQNRNTDARLAAQEVIEAYRSGDQTQGRGGVIPVSPDQGYRAVLRQVEAANGGAAKFEVIERALPIFSVPSPEFQSGQLRLVRIAIALENSLWPQEAGRWKFMGEVGENDLAEVKRIIGQLPDTVERQRLLLEQTVLEGRWHLSIFRNPLLKKGVGPASGTKALQLLSHGLRMYKDLMDQNAQAENERVEQVELNAIAAVPSVDRNGPMGVVRAVNVERIRAIREGWGTRLYLDERMVLHLMESRQCREALGATLKLLVDEATPNAKPALCRQGIDSLQPLLALKDTESSPQQIELTKRFVEFFWNAR